MAWSADGKYIYFTSDRAGERNIWKMNADGSGEAVQITTIGAYRATPAPDGKTVFFTKWGFPKEFWRVPVEGGAEEIVPEITTAGFFNIWTMTKAGFYFLSPILDQNLKLKFYDFTDGQVEDAPGNYKIPSNLDGTFITTDGNVLLWVVNKSNALKLVIGKKIAGSARILACYVAESGVKALLIEDFDGKDLFALSRSARKDACAPRDYAFFLITI